MGCAVGAPGPLTSHESPCDESVGVDVHILFRDAWDYGIYASRSESENDRGGLVMRVKNYFHTSVLTPTLWDMLAHRDLRVACIL